MVDEKMFGCNDVNHVYAIQKNHLFYIAVSLNIWGNTPVFNFRKKDTNFCP